jgi:hypothetical protein
VWVDLSDGPHALRVELAQGGCRGPCSLRWQRQGSQDYEVVPAAALFRTREAAAAARVPTREVAFALRAGELKDHKEVIHAALDAVGNVYLLGQYRGKLSLALGRPELTCAGKGFFVAKVSPRGEPLWLRPLSGTACALAVSPGGEAHITGWSGEPLGVGAEKQLPGARGQWVFVWKLSSDGRPVWAHGRALGDGGKAGALGLAVDSRGAVCLTGHFSGVADFDPNPGIFALRAKNKQDLFVWKLDRDGRFLWAHRLGADGHASQGYAVAVDAADNIVVAGRFPAGADSSWGEAIAPGARGLSNGLVLKLSPAGKLLWHRAVGGRDGDAPAVKVAVDAGGYVYLLGHFRGEATFLGVEGAPAFSAQPRGLYLARLSPDGRPLWVRASSSPDPGLAEYLGLATAPDGSLHLALRTSSDPSGELTGPRHFGGDGGLLLQLCAGDGRFVRSQQLGVDVYPTALAIDARGALHAAGFFGGTLECDPEPGKARLTARGGKELFLMKLNPPR